MTHGRRRLLLAVTGWAVASAGCACWGVAEDLPPRASTVRGLVLADGLCEPVAGAQVAVADGGPSTVSAADGRFELSGVPAGATLRVSGPGLFPTNSAAHTLAAEAELDLAAMREGTVELLPLVSGFPANQGRGAVLLSVTDAARFPLGGAAVELVRADGRPSGQRRYGLPVGQGLFFNDGGVAQTDPAVGLVAFFEVPPGAYEARASREGYAFAPLPLVVEAGAATVSLYPGEGAGGVVPVEMSGSYLVSPPYCSGGPLRPAVGARVVVYDWTDGGTIETATGDAGEFKVTLPFYRHMVDVTVVVDGGGYPTMRSRGFCALHSAVNTAGSAAFTDAQQEAWLNVTLGGRELDPDAGQVLTAVERRYLTGVSQGVAGAVLRLEPATTATPPAYDVTAGAVPVCARRACSAPGDCTADERCEGGECLLGATGPLCQRCDAGAACPGGTRGEWVNNFAVGSTACHCLPERTGCPSACPVGTFCYAWGQCGGGPLRHVCLPHGVRPTTTQVSSNGLPRAAMIANVPQGRYTLHAELDGGFFYPSWVRVSPGVVNDVMVTGP